MPEFSGLVGPLNPNGVPLTTEQLTQLHQTLGPARELPPVPDDGLPSRRSCTTPTAPPAS